MKVSQPLSAGPVTGSKAVADCLRKPIVLWILHFVLPTFKTRLTSDHSPTRGSSTVSLTPATGTAPKHTILQSPHVSPNFSGSSCGSLLLIENNRDLLFRSHPSPLFPGNLISTPCPESRAFGRANKPLQHLFRTELARGHELGRFCL